MRGEECSDGRARRLLSGSLALRFDSGVRACRCRLPWLCSALFVAVVEFPGFALLARTPVALPRSLALLCSALLCSGSSLTLTLLWPSLALLSNSRNSLIEFHLSCAGQGWVSFGQSERSP